MALAEKIMRETAGQTRGKPAFRAPAQPLLDLFGEGDSATTGTVLDIKGESSNFVDNMRLPVHRWFRYSAGFSAEWVKSVLAAKNGGPQRVLDPFVGSGTTCLACDEMGVPSIGLEAHPFVIRVARAKLSYAADAERFTSLAAAAVKRARGAACTPSSASPLMLKCFSVESLDALERLRTAIGEADDASPEASLLWLALVASLRPASEAGTAPWQYVLPGRRKTVPLDPALIFQRTVSTFAADMRAMARGATPLGRIENDDARECRSVPDGWATLVITSPPYANNYDYADATRLEMTFLREIAGWGDLQEAVRRHLVRACSQHVPPGAVDLAATLEHADLAPIRAEIQDVCRQLSALRLERGGKKTYNNMVACYFLDMARVWKALRRACATGAEVCFVVGDSAPYGVYVPVVEWLGKLAVAAGFESWTFDKLRDRNTKWKNRKHRVPLCEGHLWVRG
jgi:hypothetical protein